MSQCVITGCALVIDEMNCWGDLHEEGGVWIFNANLCSADHPAQEEVKGETKWNFGSPVPAPIKQVVYRGISQPFERRGVIVLDKRLCELNPAARDYIRS